MWAAGSIAPDGSSEWPIWTSIWVDWRMGAVPATLRASFETLLTDLTSATGQPSSNQGGTDTAYCFDDDISNDTTRLSLDGTCFALHTSDISPEPQTYRQAIQSKDRVKWKAAMDAEIEQLQAQQTWTLVHPPKGKKIVDCKRVFKIKPDSEGNVTRYKAR